MLMTLFLILQSLQPQQRGSVCCIEALTVSGHAAESRQILQAQTLCLLLGSLIIIKNGSNAIAKAFLSEMKPIAVFPCQVAESVLIISV